MKYKPMHFVYNNNKKYVEETLIVVMDGKLLRVFASILIWKQP